MIHAMGLRNWAHNKRLSDPVSGTYRLTSCSSNSGGAAYENCHMHGVVVGPGVGPVAVEHYCTAPTKRWPHPGDTVPVTVDRADPTRLRIEWDQVSTGSDRGQQLAEDLAATMRASTQPAATFDASGEPFSDLMQAFVKQAEAQGAHVTTNVTHSVIGAPGRSVPGTAGGGLTPEQAAAAVTAGSMQRGTARVLAVHEVTVPPGMPGGGAAGTVDITLDVTPPAGEGWTSTMRIAFSTPEKRARVATVGAMLPVLVNPEAHDQIAIDTARLT